MINGSDAFEMIDTTDEYQETMRCLVHLDRRNDLFRVIPEERILPFISDDYATLYVVVFVDVLLYYIIMCCFLSGGDNDEFMSSSPLSPENSIHLTPISSSDCKIYRGENGQQYKFHLWTWI